MFNSVSDLSDGVFSGLLSEVEKLNQALTGVQQSISTIRKRQEQSLKPSTAKERPPRDLENITNEAQQTLTSLIKKTAALEKRVNALPQGTSNRVTVANQLLKFKKNYKETVHDFYQMQTLYSEKQRGKISKELRIVYPDASNEEIDRMVESGASGQVFAQALQSSSRYGAAKSALAEVENRQIQLRRLNQSVEELAQLFTDFSVLVENQNYMVEQVERHVDTAANNLEQGDQEVAQAIVHRKSQLKCLWILCIIVLLLIGGLCIYIYINYFRN